jgi:hypothetical protein
LHVDAVWLETQVGRAADVTAIGGVGEQGLFDVVEVAVEDLLGERQALRAEDLANIRVLGEEPLVGWREGLDA